MPILRLKLSDLATLSDSASESLTGSVGDLEVQVRKQFTFLPNPSSL